MLAPAVTIGTQPPQSLWIAAATWSVIHAWYASWRRARSSLGIEVLDQDAWSLASTA